MPPYVISHDKMLIKLLEARPASRAGMVNVPDAGEAKLDSYGSLFLAVIAKHV